MPTLHHPNAPRRARQAPVPLPLPHPSWRNSGDKPPLARISASDFWNRLGL